MPLLPANALDRVLTWNDFSRRTLPTPAPGVFATAAQTAVGLNLGPLRLVPLPGSGPRRFRINVEPNVTVNFDRARSWVAAFLFGWPRAEQDALLGHEQTHYLIGALLARDLFRELAVLQRRDYPSTAAGLQEIRAVQARFSQALMQAVHDKYDRDTRHDPVHHPMAQSLWTGTVQAARQFDQPLRDYLGRARLLP